MFQIGVGPSRKLIGLIGMLVLRFLNTESTISEWLADVSGGRILDSGFGLMLQWHQLGLESGFLPIPVTFANCSLLLPIPIC